VKPLTALVKNRRNNFLSIQGAGFQRRKSPAAARAKAEKPTALKDPVDNPFLQTGNHIIKGLCHGSYFIIALNIQFYIQITLSDLDEACASRRMGAVIIPVR
jgi:hypothetical protein